MTISGCFFRDREPSGFRCVLKRRGNRIGLFCFDKNVSSKTSITGRVTTIASAFFCRSPRFRRFFCGHASFSTSAKLNVRLALGDLRLWLVGVEKSEDENLEAEDAKLEAEDAKLAAEDSKDERQIGVLASEVTLLDEFH